MDLVSIIIPVYNVDKYVEQCIMSCVNQTYSNIEVIVVNDGSTDSSGSICRSLKERFNRIVLVETENKGVSNARNIGIENAKGEWVTFVDGDDWIEENTVELLANFFKEGEDILMFGYNQIFPDKIKKVVLEEHSTELVQTDFKEFQKWVINHYYRPGHYAISAVHGKVYKRQFIEDNQLNFKLGVTIGQDIVFNLAAYEKASKGYYLCEELYNYRILQSSAVRKYRPDGVGDIEFMLSFIEEYRRVNDIECRLGDSYQVRLVVSLMYFIVSQYCHKENNLEFKERKKEYQDKVAEYKYKNALRNVRAERFPLQQRVLFLLIKYGNFEMISIVTYLKNKKDEIK